MFFVSISHAGKLLSLRRYEGRHKALTHAGFYAPETATAANVENYREWGAAQDRLPPPH